MNQLLATQFLNTIEAALESLRYPYGAATLCNPIKYTFASGGKRIRPILTMAAAQAVCSKGEVALRQALAIEMFHNFTLIHDDVMDHSDRRRGHQTVVRRWGENQAILSGDALMTMATQMLISDCPADKLNAALELFNTTAMDVYRGQQLDTDFEHLSRVSVNRYVDMVRLKTSVLLGCACRMGALMAGADSAQQELFYQYGENLGVAFQLRDDWLDSFGDPAVFGKNIGGDIVNHKKTWLFITASHEAPETMAAALSEGRSRAALIARVKKVYKMLKLSERCDTLIWDYYNRAVDAINRTDISEESRRWFEALASQMCHRSK